MGARLENAPARDLPLIPGGAAMPVFDPFDTESVARRLLAFLQGQAGETVEIGPLRRFTVGFSWVTYGFAASWTEGGRRVSRDLVLRAGPPNGIFGPYRAAPEFTALRALEGSAARAPKAFWRCDDLAVLGAPFIICERVRGEAPIPWSRDGRVGFDEASRVSLGEQFLEALAALHNFDWRGTGIETIGGATRAADAVEAEIESWSARMRGWSARRYPILDFAIAWFRAHAPKTSRISIVHGDYRIGNFLVAEGKITAILDWELVHLGDPLEDLGWICMQAWRGRSNFMCHLVTREELAEKYARLTGVEVDPAALRYWEAFGTFKLAVMHLAAAHSFETLGFNDMRMAGMAAQIPRMLLQVEAALEKTA